MRCARNLTSLEGLFEATQVHGLDILWEWTALFGDEELLLARTHGWHGVSPSLCASGGREWRGFLRLLTASQTASLSHCPIPCGLPLPLLWLHAGTAFFLPHLFIRHSSPLRLCTRWPLDCPGVVLPCCLPSPSRRGSSPLSLHRPSPSLPSPTVPRHAATSTEGCPVRQSAQAHAA